MSLADTLLKRLPRSDEAAHKTQLLTGEYETVGDRGISQLVCKLYNYTVSTFKGQSAQVANYRDNNGLVVAQHVRYGQKQFAWLGRQKGVPVQLFGQHLGSNGRLILTEGELDAMSVAEVMRQGTPAAWREPIVVASIPDGATSAKRSVAEQMEWVSGFSQVVIFFDQDEPGQKAAVETAEVIGPKAVIVGKFAYKDANEALLAKDAPAIREAVTSAHRHRPRSVVYAPDLLENILHPVNRQGLPFPWDGWNSLTEGMKPGELWMLSGGTGIGKSLFSRSICLNLTKQGVKCAYVGLEESCETTLERMLSEELRLADPPFHLQTTEQRQRFDPERIRAALDAFAGNLFLLDKFGSEDFDSFVATVKHYVLGEGCRVVFLDHFSLLADGIALGTDQRRAIDKCIKDLKTLCVEHKFTMVSVCHLSRDHSYSTPVEEGGEPHLGMLRGSHSLAQIPDYIVMLQRNPNAKFADGTKDTHEANITRAWLKKNRVKGELGLMSKLKLEPSCIFTELP